MVFSDHNVGSYDASVPAGGKRYKYDYPEGLDLRPWSDLHRFIAGRLRVRAQESYNHISKKFEGWRENERSITGYVPLDAFEKKQRAKDSRRPVSIVVPASFVNMETILAHLATAFLVPPYLRYTGVSPEDVIGVAMLEKVIEHQCLYSKMALALHIQWRDFLIYGFGVDAPTWTTEWREHTTAREQGRFGFGGLFGTRTIKERKRRLAFEGNKLVNISPFNYRPDPNVPIHLQQEGEYNGFELRENYMGLLRRERNGDGFFNVRYLEHLGSQGTSRFRSHESERERDGSSDVPSSSSKSIDILYMYIDLIPRDWRVGTSGYPEKWLFALAADQVIIRAQPMDLDHNQFPVSVAAPAFDGYTSTPIATLEMEAGLQKVLNHHFNLDLARSIKSLDGTTVVDPSIINMKDLQTPTRGGRLIRARRRGFNTKLEDAIYQLKFESGSPNAMADISMVMDFMQRISGANEALQGVFRKSPERMTGSEARDTRLSALSRLGLMARLVSIMSLHDIAKQCASNTIQLMSEKTYVRVIGRYEEELREEYGVSGKGGLDRDRMRVTPFDIAVNYDVEISDGSVARSEYVDVWAQILQVITASPESELAQRLDQMRVFKHWARLAGADNVSDFEKKPPAQVQSQDQIAQGVQRGNLVSMPEAEAAGMI